MDLHEYIASLHKILDPLFSNNLLGFKHNSVFLKSHFLDKTLANLYVSFSVCVLLCGWSTLEPNGINMKLVMMAKLDYRFSNLVSGEIILNYVRRVTWKKLSAPINNTTKAKAEQKLALLFQRSCRKVTTLMCQILSTV